MGKRCFRDVGTQCGDLCAVYDNGKCGFVSAIKGIGEDIKASLHQLKAAEPATTLSSLCPVCFGCGHVPANFYSNDPDKKRYVTCRACGGRGVVR